MTTTIKNGPRVVPRYAGSGVLALLWIVAPPAPCDELTGTAPPAAPGIPPAAFDWTLAPESTVSTPAAADSLVIRPRGNELSALAGVELQRSDRRFRAQVVEWFSERSVAAGLASDLLLHGSDTGFYVEMRPGSEYQMRWATRF